MYFYVKQFYFSKNRNNKLFFFKAKGIRTQEKEKQAMNLLENPMNHSQKVVTIAEDGESLQWPVLFLYPEFGQTDFIESFHENST